MTDEEWAQIAPYMKGSRSYYEGLKPSYEGAQFTVCANVYCEQVNDYVEHFEGHTFSNYEMAVDYWEQWMPPMEEVRKAVRECHAEFDDENVSDHYEIEVAIWDEDGNCPDEYFYNETVEGWQ